MGWPLSCVGANSGESITGRTTIQGPIPCDGLLQASSGKDLNGRGLRKGGLGLQ